MRRLVHVELCVLLAAAVWLAPIAAVNAQLPAETGQPGVDTRFVTPQTVALAYLKPGRIMQAPLAEFLPTEVASAAGLKYLGIDPADVESIQVVVEPPLGASLFFAAVAKTTQPIDLDAMLGKLPPEIAQQFESTEVGGKPFLKPTQENQPGVYLPTPTTLVVATQPMLKKLFNKRSDTQSGLVLDRVQETPVDDDLYVMVNIETLRPLIGIAMMQAAQEVPPPMQKFLSAPDLIRDAELSLNISGSGASQLIVHANDAEDAQQLVSLLDEAKGMMQAQQQAEIERMLASEDEIEQAMGRYMQRMQAKMDLIQPMVDGDTFTVFKFDDLSAANPTILLAVAGVLAAMLMPAVGSARMAARQNMSMNNMKQILLAMHNYHDTRKSFPPHAIYSDDGKPLLSWRVAILPYIEEQALYRQFRLDEPWDSEHNLQLAKQMPAVYLDPASTLDVSEGKTNYLGVSGDNGVFPPQKNGVQFRTITDGTSNTVAVVQVDDDSAVIWTKPDDYEFDAADPLGGLGGLRPNSFLAGFCDGHAAMMPNAIDAETWKAMTTRNGGEVVDW